MSNKSKFVRNRNFEVYGEENNKIFHYAGKYNGDESRKDVYMYNDLAHMLMFVVGTEDMSKGRFIFMCLCPNLILGIIPYILFLIFPQFVGLGLFGIICIGMGFGDYLNIYNAIKQMPKNSKTYLCGMHSYWYM